MSSAHIIGGYWGMGDNVMQFPLVRELAARFDAVYLTTPWPQLYWQLPNLRFVFPSHENPELFGWTHFRENIDAQPPEMWIAPRHVPADAVRFYWGSGGNVVDGANTRLSVTCPQVPLPARISSGIALRGEWLRAARQWLDANVPGDRPRVLMHVPMAPPGVELARDARFGSFAHIYDAFHDAVAFFDAARIEPGICEPIGRLAMPVFSSFGPQVTTLWALVALADAVVASPCHMSDLAMAFLRPTLLLIGGSLSAGRLYDPRLDLSRLIAVEPEPFCECNLPYHDCHKTLERDTIVAAYRRTLTFAKTLQMKPDLPDDRICSRPRR